MERRMTSGGKEEGSQRKEEGNRRKEEADTGLNPAEKKKEADGKEEADAGFNPAEKKKGEGMATGIMDDGDAG